MEVGNLGHHRLVKGSGGGMSRIGGRGGIDLLGRGSL